MKVWIAPGRNVVDEAVDMARVYAHLERPPRDLPAADPELVKRIKDGRPPRETVLDRLASNDRFQAARAKRERFWKVGVGR